MQFPQLRSALDTERQMKDTRPFLTPLLEQSNPQGGPRRTILVFLTGGSAKQEFCGQARALARGGNEDSSTPLTSEW